MERNRSLFFVFFFFVLSLRFTNVYQTQELANKRSVCSLPETIFIKIFFETLQRYLYYPECYINSSSFTYYHLYLHRYIERKKNRHFRVDNLYIYICIYNFRLPLPRDPRRNTCNICHVTRALLLSCASSFNERNRSCYASSDMLDRDVTIFPFFCGDSFKG